MFSAITWNEDQAFETRYNTPLVEWNAVQNFRLILDAHLVFLVTSVQ